MPVLARSASQSIKISIKSSEGLMYPLEVESAESVNSLRTKISVKGVKNVSDFNLQLRGKEMLGGQTLRECGIVEGDIIFLVPKVVATKPKVAEGTPLKIFVNPPDGKFLTLEVFFILVCNFFFLKVERYRYNNYNKRESTTIQEY
jgi:hypothetical protein